MKTVWEFTNKRKLTAAEFVKYFEKKVKSTIRKYKMPVSSMKGNTLKIKVINNVLKNIPLRKGKLSDNSLDDISVSVLHETMYGKHENLSHFLPHNQPLYFLSDKEIILYAQIVKIKGTINQRTGKKKQVDEFIKKIEKKNPDIRHNIINSLVRIS